MPNGEANAGFAINSIRTFRFEWLNRAARLLASCGAKILQLPTDAPAANAFTQATSGSARLTQNVRPLSGPAAGSAYKRPPC